MKLLPAICLLPLGLLAACKEKEKEKPAPAAMIEKKELPGKERAAKAAENVLPGLKRDLAAAGLKFGANRAIVR